MPKNVAPYSSVASSPSVFSSTTLAIDDGVNDSKGPLGLRLLHSPSNPLIDFIFVHGLGGGSRKTWSKTTSVRHYWPQEWLPKDPAFQGVRVHSFGYNSDWVNSKDNCLNIHHFGKMLLGEMRLSPHLDADTPIVLIGHSMGGLVIKKAYILARKDIAFETLAKRFHTMYFLATPHRGSDSAKLLNGILQVAYSSRAYIVDLIRNSWALQTINDEFREFSADIDLWSFYETQKLSMGGLFSTLIVDTDSGTLGYRGEKQIPMNADHRSICKFDTVTDPNYFIVRNALASTVNNISKIVLKSKEKLWRSQIEDLKRYLNVPENVEDDLIITEDARLSRTCEWLLTKHTYLTWKDCAPDTPSVLWVTGEPATGKTILAGYAIKQLQSVNGGCSYFFFKYGNNSKSQVGACLRSMAFQMACTNVQVRETLLEMQKNGIKLDEDSDRAIWRKLFLSCIFRTKLSRHYWVIDALDECVDFSSFFDLILPKFDESIPLRILIISRETSQLKKNFTALGTHRFQSERISIADTLPDIKRFVETKTRHLAVKNEDDHVSLVEKILSKSQGSFLWTVLVLREVSNSISEEEINQVLDDVPKDMEPLYQRSLELMSQVTRGKKLTNAILTWATCATRPLDIKELDGALKVDFKENFLKVEETVLAVCGQLVTVDRFGKVQMVHETAREFLLNSKLESEFAINKREAHTQIARTCLLYLTGEEMKPPRSSRRGAAMMATRKRAEFSAYACAAFSYHLAKADPLTNDIFVLVDKFLKSNVLSWIEIIAQTRNLLPLIRTAKNLRTYIDSCSIERSPLDKEIQTIRGWTTGLVRIAAKFVDALITSPSAIYSLILPFCPTESTVYKATHSGRRLSVVGLSNAHWDDRLTCINFPQGRPSAICYGDEFFAVGFMTGIVTLYDAKSCQEYKVLDHGEPVKFLQFKSKSDLMASCGMKTIRIWDIHSGEEIHNLRPPPRPICLEFNEDILIAASPKNYVASWDMGNNAARQPDRPWNDSVDHLDAPLRRPPCAITISVSHQMLAVAYSWKPIMLWDLEGDTYYGTCGKKQPSGKMSTDVVSALVFNPNVDIGLLAVSYLDGNLVLLDPFSDQELEGFRANCQTLAASPDGRLLAGGVGCGTIHIYDFETLRLLYRVTSSNLHIKQLAFSRDNLRIADIRGFQCNIWEPAVLLGGLVSDQSSEDISMSVVEAVVSDSQVKISAMILHPMEEIVFCGKEDGSVASYDLKTGAELRTLYHHKSLVRILTWWPQSNIIMSVDASNGIYAWNLQKTQQDGWIAEKKHFQARLNCERSIIQVLPCEAAGKFILSARESAYLWTINGQQQDARIYSGGPGIGKWIQHQQSALHVICIEGTTARVYTWSDWSEIAFMSLDIDIKGLQLKNAISYKSSHKEWILVEFSELDGSAHTRGIHFLDAASFSIDNELIKTSTAEADDTNISIEDETKTSVAAASSPLLHPQLKTLTHFITHIIGLSDTGKLIFLDTHAWVCSADLSELGNSNSVSYMRHFFVPYDWFSGTRDIICAVAKRDVLFARNNDVAIIKGGLEFVEKVHVDLEVIEAKVR